MWLNLQLLDAIETKLGTMAEGQAGYVRVLGSVRQEIGSQRRMRKVKARVQAVSDPQAFARRKTMKQQKKQKVRKEKTRQQMIMKKGGGSWSRAPAQQMRWRVDGVFFTDAFRVRCLFVCPFLYLIFRLLWAFVVPLGMCSRVGTCQCVAHWLPSGSDYRDCILLRK